MKKIYLILFMTFTTFVLPHTSYSLDKSNRIKNKAKQRADTKIDNATDKGLDEVEGKNKQKVKTEEVGVKQKTKTAGVAQNDTVPDANAGTQLSYTSKYD